MKKIIYLTAIMGLLLGSSCSDYLEEENLSNATAESFYLTSSGYESLINSAYSTLRDVYNPEPYMFSAGTDLFFAGGPEAPQALTSYESLTPGTSQVGDFFQSLYESIQIQNIALHYGELVEDFPELESRMGEVRFLRAYYYFLLAQSFGDVTLVTEMVEEPITHFERQPVEDVYEFIIDELEMALEAVPAEQGNFGRVTRVAVLHLLAKVHLTRGYEDFAAPNDFEQAATYGEAAIDGKSLNVPFDEIFAYNNDMNEEVIFSIQYDEISTMNGGTHAWDRPWGPLITGAGEGVDKKLLLRPTEYLYTVFGEYDSRFEGTFMNVRHGYYAGYYLDPENSSVTYYYPRTEEQLANVDEWRAENPETRSGTRVVPLGPTWWDIYNQGEYPALMKFDRVRINQPGVNVQYTHDLFLMRLGETYLNTAEAHFQTGNIERAVELINEVRIRAAMEDHESEMLITASELDIDFILDERARELAGEGHRWFDLKRTGKLIERTVEHNPDITSESQFAGNNGALKILRPIPLRAISLDEGEYPQNPAYAN